MGGEHVRAEHQVVEGHLVHFVHTTTTTATYTVTVVVVVVVVVVATSMAVL